MKAQKEFGIKKQNFFFVLLFRGKPLHIHFKCSKCDSIIYIDNKDLKLEYIKLNKKS